VLADRLRAHYEGSHPVVLYEAAQFPICDPVVITIPLAELAERDVPATMTVYIPPKPASLVDDEEVAAWLSAGDA
jgi:hypothetical protein